MTSERKLANSWRTRSGWQWTNERPTFLGCYVLFRAPSSRHLVGALRQLSLILGFHYKLLVRSVALVFQNVFIKMIDWSLWNWRRLSEHALCLSKCPRTYVRTCVSWLVLAPNMRVYIEPAHVSNYYARLNTRNLPSQDHNNTDALYTLPLRITCTNLCYRSNVQAWIELSQWIDIVEVVHLETTLLKKGIYRDPTSGY